MIKNSFRLTGLWPLDPTVIKPAQMAPSYAMSTKGMFPLEQSSPVRAIIAWVSTPLGPPPSPGLSNIDPTLHPPAASTEATANDLATTETPPAELEPDQSWLEHAAGLQRALKETRSGPGLLSTS